MTVAVEVGVDALELNMHQAGTQQRRLGGLQGVARPAAADHLRRYWIVPSGRMTRNAAVVAESLASNPTKTRASGVIP